MDRRMGLFCCLAASKAWSPQGYQSTGLSACCNRYGLVSAARRLRCMYSSASVRMHDNISEVLSMSDLKLAAELPALRLKRNEDRRLHAGHLWIFSNEVDAQQTPLPKFKAGELGRVLAHNDRALGLGYVNPQSLISARMLETRKLPDAAWFAARMRAAVSLSERLDPRPYY